MLVAVAPEKHAGPPVMMKISHQGGASSHFNLPLSSVLQVLLTAWSAISSVLSAILTIVAHFILPVHSPGEKAATVYCTKDLSFRDAQELTLADGIDIPIPRLLLPASATRKLTVVLDLDETLVCTYPSDQIPSWLQMSAPQRRPMRRIQYGRSGHPSNTIIVYERPGLQEFLTQASASCHCTG
jgi:hypothetical protein